MTIFALLAAALVSPVRAADFPISHFGAKTGGEKCTAAFAAAFAAAGMSGGGRVVVPPGRWCTGAIRFRSGCELHLSEGAEVVFSQDPEDYLLAIRLCHQSASPGGTYPPIR